MTWLWVIAPLIVVIGALWLADMTRRLSRMRVEPGVATESRLEGVRGQQERLRAAADRLRSRRGADTSPDDEDR